MKRKQTSLASEQEHNPKSRHVTLPHGVVHLKGFLCLKDQEELVKSALEIGSKPRGGFFSCNNEKTRRMKMMNLGKHVHNDDCNENSIPEFWQELAMKIATVARERDSSLPMLRPPDVCVVNCYTARSKLSPHVDVLTRRDPGAPIVSISVGLACDFVFKKGWGKKTKEHSIRLDSGDALVFGGPARSILHSVPRIYPNGPNGLRKALLSQVPTPHVRSLLSGLFEDRADIRGKKGACSSADVHSSTGSDLVSDAGTSHTHEVDEGMTFRLNFNFRER